MYERSQKYLGQIKIKEKVFVYENNSSISLHTLRLGLDMSAGFVSIGEFIFAEFQGKSFSPASLSCSMNGVSLKCPLEYFAKF